MLLNENLFETIDNVSKDEYLRDAAKISWESGHSYDPDDFSYFKKVYKEDGYTVNEEDFQKYWEYFDECRAKQFADEDDTDDINLGDWEEMESKQVEDSDGFMIDYTWYVKDNDDGSETHIMIFGDKDMYHPLNSEPDAEFDGEEVAREWFDNYKGFAEDLDEDYHKDSFGQSNWYENVDDVMHDYEKGWLTKARAIEICEEEGWEFYDDLDEAINNSAKDYIIEYYDNIPAAERRPSTIDDVENYYKEDVVAFPDDFSACIYALAIHDQADYEFNQKEYLEEFGYADELKTTADVITKLDDIDWGDGSIIICKITQSGRVVYDSGLSKESLLKDIDDENLDESIDDIDEIYNGYVVRKSDTSDNYFVYDNNGHVEDDEHKGQGYSTKEEAIERANSLEKGIAESNSDLEEAIKPNIESEELKALAQKHNIKILDAMSNGDLRMEGAGADLMKFYQEAEKLGLWEVNTELYEALHGKEEIKEFTELAKKLGFTTMAQMQHIMNAAKSLGKSELEMLKSVDETFDGKIPDTLIDGLTDEFLIIADDIGIETQEDYERFCNEEVEPGETITQAIKRYRDEIREIDENVLTEIAILNVNEPAIFDAIANAKSYIHEKKYSQAKDSLNYAANLLVEPMNEGAMSNLDLEIKEAGGKKNWKEKARKELSDMIEHLEYLKTYAPKEVNAGGNYDSIEELQDDIEDLEKSINDLNSKLDYVDSVTSVSDD